MNIREKIQNNPFRILGVHVGDPVSLELRNKNKIAAYSRVGQKTSFSFTIDEKLDGIERDEASAENALRILALPKDRLTNALFWIGDGKSEWSKELNCAIYALLEGKLLNAIYHYGNLFYNETLRNEFQQAVTQGLMNLSKEELTKILCANLVNDDAELLLAFKRVDISLKPNQIIRQLCNQTIIRNLEKTLSLNDVITYMVVNNQAQIEFYSSFDNLKVRIDEYIPLIKVVGWVYGKDSAIYEEFAERIIRNVYENATFIVDAIGKWAWVYDKKTMRNGERCKLVSVRTRQCVDGCMHLISDINELVSSTVDRLHPSRNSIRILLPIKYNYERSLGKEYVADESLIIKAVKKHKISRLVSDLIWLAILGLIFFLV